MGAPRYTLAELQALGLRATDQETGNVIATPAPTFCANTKDSGAQTKADLKNEAELQKLCEQELGRRGIEYLHLSPKAREKKGWPDLTFVTAGHAWAIELKTDTGKLSPDQKDILPRMESNGWEVRIVRTFDDFRAICAGDLNAGKTLDEELNKPLAPPSH
jgi:hypothetical protein